jgi:protease YdgD
MPSAAQVGLPAAQELKLPSASKPAAKLPGDSNAGEGTLNLRTSVNQYALPWSAVGRLMGGRISCTASLIGPSLLLTAAHCVFNPATQRPFAPQELHFMLGYSQGRYVAEAHGVRLTYAETYDPSRGTETSGDDWALVDLDRPIGTPDRVLSLRTDPLTGGDIVTLGGYAQERIEMLMVDTRCRILGLMSDRNGVALLHHDCTANHGVSGAPLLIQEGDVWVIGGIEVTGTSANDGGAATLTGVHAALARRGN